MKLKISDLVPGASYWIKSKDTDGSPWEGIAFYNGPETSGHYPDGLLSFTCEDGTEGVFKIEEVSELTQHQGSLSDQLKELQRIAVRLKLYDAADFLRNKIVS